MPLFPEPLDSADTTTWAVYADYLEENGGDHEFARAVSRGLARPPFLLLCGRRRGVLYVVERGKPGWRELLNRRWWTATRLGREWWPPRSCPGPNQVLFWRRVLNECPATPADFPGLAQDYPRLARRFFRLLVRGTTAPPRLDSPRTARVG